VVSNFDSELGGDLQPYVGKPSPFARFIAGAARNKRVLIISFLLVFSVQAYSQYQYLKIIESADQLDLRGGQYRDVFNATKPKINDQGFYEYEGWYGEYAWDKYVSTFLNKRAEETLDDMTLLVYKLERRSILPIYRSKVEAKSQLILYYSTFNKYLLNSSLCSTSKCYEKAVSELNTANWNVVTESLKAGVPRLDILKLGKRVQQIVG
jgi:hypothetical protein